MKRFPRLWNTSNRSWLLRPICCLLLAVIIVGTMILAGCGSPDGFDSQFDAVLKDYRFSLVSFHVNALAGEIGKVFTGGPDVSAEDADTVVEFFASQERSEESREKVEAILEAQVREAYREADIYQPFSSAGWEFTFPPFNFHFDEPPFLVVVSPRDGIERYREALLVPGMTLAEAEEIEVSIEELGYSALVVRLGGVATYPAYVSSNTGIQQALGIGAEEWLHQYLAFTPLGFRYVLHLLGIRKDSEIVTMNETVAGIVSDEIAERIFQEYYAESQDEGELTDGSTGFDFNAAMRETRLHVDELLEEGRVLEAEQYMSARRDFIEENGYYIRKLNQAYFAFYGSYADSPTSVDPIGEELRTLRADSDSVEQFLDTVTRFTERQDLADSIE